MNTQPLGWTTIEQSKQLLEAGLDKDTADMYYLRVVGDSIVPIDENNSIIQINGWNGYHYYDYSQEDVLQCWSLGKLLDLMPKDDAIQWELSVGTYRISDGIDENDFCVDVESVGNYKPFINKDLVQAVVDAVIYCLEQSYIKKGETK
jgi:hypothetical protein